MARGKRGGNQPPKRPAAVSGPGALSARTDGNVPQMLPSGGDYGDRTALATQQAGATMTPPTGPAGGGGPTPAAARGGPPQMGPAGAFSPTQRPGEPLTAGTDWGAGPGAPARPDLGDDPLMLLRVLYEQNPTPQLARVLARMTAQRRA